MCSTCHTIEQKCGEAEDVESEARRRALIPNKRVESMEQINQTSGATSEPDTERGVLPPPEPKKKCRFCGAEKGPGICKACGKDARRVSAKNPEGQLPPPVKQRVRKTRVERVEPHTNGDKAPSKPATSAKGISRIKDILERYRQDLVTQEQDLKTVQFRVAEAKHRLDTAQDIFDELIGEPN